MRTVKTNYTPALFLTLLLTIWMAASALSDQVVDYVKWAIN